MRAQPRYYLETERAGVTDLLKCRTVGVCMAHNRLLGFHVVRSTRPVVWTPTSFVPERESRTPREIKHIEQYPDYPDPMFYLNHTGSYFFRHENLRHLRIGQYNRYFSTNSEKGAAETLEDTCGDEDMQPKPDHHHYDSRADGYAAGTCFPSAMRHVDGVRRRKGSRLAVSRVGFIEPIAASREKFYEQKLLLALSWYCESPPIVRAGPGGKELAEWTFFWDPPPAEELGAHLLREVLVLAPDRAVPFEEVCAKLESTFCGRQYGLVCVCCANDNIAKQCRACQHAIGFHRCLNQDVNTAKLRWRKGTLYGGHLDIERVLFNLHRKCVPTTVLEEKADECPFVLTSPKDRWLMRAADARRARPSHDNRNVAVWVQI